MVLPGFTIVLLLILLVSSSVTARKEAESSRHGLVNLNRENWSKFVNEHNNVLVKFFANWCGNCRFLAPEYAKLAEKYLEDDRIIIAEVDVDAEPSLARENHLSYVPLMRFFRQGSPEEFGCEYEVGQLSKCVEDRLSKK